VILKSRLCVFLWTKGYSHALTSGLLDRANIILATAYFYTGAGKSKEMPDCGFPIYDHKRSETPLLLPLF